MKSVSEKKSKGHRTSKIAKSMQSCSNGHLPYHLFILVFSACARCMTWHVIRVRSKDAQKQLARTSSFSGQGSWKVLYSFAVKVKKKIQFWFR